VNIGTKKYNIIAKRSPKEATQEPEYTQVIRDYEAGDLTGWEREHGKKV